MVGIVVSCLVLGSWLGFNGVLGVFVLGAGGKGCNGEGMGFIDLVGWMGIVFKGDLSTKYLVV